MAPSERQTTRNHQAKRRTLIRTLFIRFLLEFRTA